MTEIQNVTAGDVTQMTAATVAGGGGVLANLGLENVPDGLPDGTYSGWVYDCKIVTLKNDKGQSLVFTYKVDMPGSPLNGETIDEFKSINPGDDNQKKRFLKARLESLGVPSTRFSQFQPNDVKGQPVEWTVKTNGEYKNVGTVKLRPANGMVSGNSQTPATGPAAGQPMVNQQSGASAPLSDLL